MHIQPASHACPRREEPPEGGGTTGTGMKSRIVLSLVIGIGACAVVIAILLLPGQKSAELSPSVQWIGSQRLRAGYCDPGNSTEVLQKLRECGMNAVITYASPERAKEVSGLYESMGLHLFVSIPFLVEGSDYRHSVKSDGTEKVAPCPLDSSYWTGNVLNRLVSLAEASRTYPIDGVLIDTEMGGSPSAHYYSEALCFCEDCIRRFAKASGKDPETILALPNSERYKWLESEGYLEQYYDLLEKRTEEMVRGFEERIHEINPDLILGFLLYEDNWYYRALARGLSTPSMPVLVLDETTYVRGYSCLVDEILEYFRSRRLNVLYLPGLWLLHHPPGNITAQIYYLAANTSGYWIFPLGSLWTENLTGDSRLAGPRDPYWESLASANLELDRYVGGGYLSGLARPAPEVPRYQFGVLEDQESILIQNMRFADRREVRVAVNGKVVAKMRLLGAKRTSDPIRFERQYISSSSPYSSIGLHHVAVTDSEGGVYNLLGETDPSVFPG